MNYDPRLTAAIRAMRRRRRRLIRTRPAGRQW